MYSEREGSAEEKLTLVIKAFQRIETAVRCTIAVRPVVVAGCESCGRVQRIKKTERLYVHCIGACGWGRRSRYTVARLKVAVVDGKCEFLPVHIHDQVRYPVFRLGIAVRQVTPEADSVRFIVVVSIIVVPVVVVSSIGSVL